MLGCGRSRTINGLLVRARLSVFVTIVVSLCLTLPVQRVIGSTSAIWLAFGSRALLARRETETFASPIYSFLPGDKVDFGTAIVSPDPSDGRAGRRGESMARASYSCLCLWSFTWVCSSSQQCHFSICGS